jgi:RNA polymerase sigma factor (sigma-70 family)
MEASSIPATAAHARQRSRHAVGPLLRLRSDEQLVRLFRAGNDDAFRAIHDRYRARLFAYTRQMLSGSRQDAEDALQDVFVRAYGALRANDREVSLRAWLYRVAHNRCIDELRRPAPPPPETLERLQPPASDPIAEAEQRESLRRLVEDVRRLPEQQRSALLMREIVGMSYADLASALDVTVPAVKSLLVRARLGLGQAAEARDTACVEIREELADAHDRGVRASGLARRHLHDCSGCRAYRRELRSMRERFAALTPTLGPFALLAKLLGIGSGGAGAAAGGTAAAGGGAAAAGGAVLGGSVSAGHVAAVVAAAVVGAGGAVEMQRTLNTGHRSARSPAADVRPLVRAAHEPQAVAAAAGAEVDAGGGAGASSHARASDDATAGRASPKRDKAQRTPRLLAGLSPIASTGPTVPAVPPGNGNGGVAAPADPAVTGPIEEPATTLPAEPTTGTPGTPGSGTSTGSGAPPNQTPGATTPSAPGTTAPPTGTGRGTTAPGLPPATSAGGWGSGSGSGSNTAPAAPPSPNRNGNGGASASPNTAP